MDRKQKEKLLVRSKYISFFLPQGSLIKCISCSYQFSYRNSTAWQKIKSYLSSNILFFPDFSWVYKNILLLGCWKWWEWVREYWLNHNYFAFQPGNDYTKNILYQSWQWQVIHCVYRRITSDIGYCYKLEYCMLRFPCCYNF